MSSATGSETPTPPVETDVPPLWTREEVTRLLREKADVYDDHPNYGWLLPGDGIGNYIAFELRSVADLIDWLEERKNACARTDRA